VHFKTFTGKIKFCWEWWGRRQKTFNSSSQQDKLTLCLLCS